jgi:hypothetical protein
MRTTVTIDDDVEKKLRAAVRRSGRPFKQVLNDALRQGLAAPAQRALTHFRQPQFDMGSPLVDLTKAANLAAELEDQETLARYRAHHAAAGR